MMEVRVSPAALSRALGEWRGPGPLQKSLQDRMRMLVLDGRLPVGAQVPSERALAESLSVSRNTVSGVYDALRGAGFLHSVVGSGTRVTLPGPALELPDLDRGEGALDLGKAAFPALSLVPAALREAASELPRFLPGAGYDTRGLPHLRAAIAGDYARRGLPTSADDILVTLGAQHAIQLLSQALLRRGQRALVETPTYPHAVEALSRAGARFLPVPVSDGWDGEEIASVLRRHEPVMAYLMPDFHNPTGASMPPETRDVILRAARKTTLVIDETTALVGADSAAFSDRTGNVVHVGSANKLFWGGLRIGWIRAPRPILDRVLAVRPAYDLGTPVMEQLTVAHLMPRVPEAVRERSSQLRAGAAALTRLAAVHLPDWTVPNPAGGLFSWIGLPRPLAVSLAVAARDHGVLVPPGPRFAPDGRGFERHLRLPLTCTPAELAIAVPALAAAWRATLDHARGGSVPHDSIVL